MADAYVLIRCDLGAEVDILKEIKQIPEVKEAHEVLGVYNVIVRVETGTMGEFLDLIKNNIRKIHGVRSTLTLIITDVTGGG